MSARLTRLGKGRRAEAAVAEHLRSKGFEILAQNLRLGALEIDLLARQGGLATLVEVRVREGGSFTGPLESITREKRRRLLRAADRVWRERLREMPGIDRFRIDVATVRFEHERAIVELFPGAIVAEPGEI